MRRAFGDTVGGAWPLEGAGGTHAVTKSLNLM
jgi:hypothetical protein